MKTSIFFIFLTLSCALDPTHLAQASGQDGQQQQQQPIKNIVVLVLENRSFDHMIGWMKKTINPSINGVTGKECNPFSTNLTNKHIQQTQESICFTDDANYVDPDPGHSFEDVEKQVFGSNPFPSMTGFVEQALSVSPNLSETVMKGFKPDNVPVFAKLVQEFAVFDRWFSSIPGPTQPNSTFRQHAKEGKLPSLSVIEPRYFDIKGYPANDDHPSHDVANGQKLVKEVYEVLRGSPQWNESLLVITYDEHGGFFDHVKTPYVNVPSPDGNTGPAPSFFKFDRLGVRVPTIMVSPWIKKGTVISSPKGPTPNSEYEHSSIPATIKKMFNLSSNFLTHRDAWAGSFEHVVSQLSSPRTDCPEVLPEAAPLRRTEPDETKGLSEFQSEVVQLAAVLNGDHFLSSFPDEMGKKMSVKEAHTYVQGAVSRFITASKEAIKLGADESAIVDMRSSLTTRTVIRN
ncbi:hypothetical protein M8C21_016755 [Ambrosia artemisiifolia]|uniref:Non-specific phospholipase C6 n=1 Tax=Ambrosia artemisiifolia TaxID=4212 RepID=A0AAD5CA98_AMBAR|nr:hypothetical protein M8C21_016755 [Ambrosia artemisiifolia]